MTEERHGHQGLPDFHLLDPESNRTRGSVVRKARLATLIIVVLLVLGLGRTLMARWSENSVLEARAAENAVLHVRVIKPRSEQGEGRLTLPGTLQGTQEAQIYARATGYVKQWFKDIGATVKKGEVLATLDIPEVSRQVEEAKANYQLAKTAYERWSRLRNEDAVSQQELDEKTSAYRQTEAVLQRLRQQLAFGEVVAPFDGTVIRRNVNIGDLVNAGNGGSAQAMFSMAQTDKLHVYAYLPQDRAAQVKVGDSVDILQASAPDKPVKARIARSANAIDLNSRTLQVDIEVPNPQRLLLPGTYVEIALKLKAGETLVLPTNTLLFGAAGPQVALVSEGKVRRQNVTLGTDFGKQVEIRSGVTANDQVIVNPPDAIAPEQSVVVEVVAPTARSTAKSAKE